MSLDQHIKTVATVHGTTPARQPKPHHLHERPLLYKENGPAVPTVAIGLLTLPAERPNHLHETSQTRQLRSYAPSYDP